VKRIIPVRFNYLQEKLGENI